jgi:hypothetical protein
MIIDNKNFVGESLFPDLLPSSPLVAAPGSVPAESHFEIGPGASRIVIDWQPQESGGSTGTIAGTTEN